MYRKCLEKVSRECLPDLRRGVERRALGTGRLQAPRRLSRVEFESSQPKSNKLEPRARWVQCSVDCRAAQVCRAVAAWVRTPPVSLRFAPMSPRPMPFKLSVCSEGELRSVKRALKMKEPSFSAITILPACVALRLRHVMVEFSDMSAPIKSHDVRPNSPAELKSTVSSARLPT